MPTTDDSGLDPQRRERIRARTLEKGTRMRRHRTIARRSATATAVVVIAGGGVLIARAAGVATSAPPTHKITVGGPPSTTTTTTVPFLGGTGLTGTTGGGTETTLPGNTGTGGPTTTVASDTTTTTSPPPTTVPVTTTTTPAPVGTSFQKTLTDVANPGTLASSTWTVPASDFFEMSNFTVSTGNSQAKGDIRVQLLSGGASPQTLFESDFTALSSPFDVSLAAPAPFTSSVTSDQVLALTLTCDSDQPACTTTFSFSGTMWTSAPSDHAYAGSLEDVVAPATVGAVHWTVPAGQTFSLSDLVLSAPGPGPTGEVTVRTISGRVPTTLLQMSYASLARRPVHDNPGLTLDAGTEIDLTVTCGTDQAACNAALLFTGHTG